MSVIEILTKIRVAKAQHKLVKMNATELRETYMNEQGELLAELYGMLDVAAFAQLRQEKSHPSSSARCGAFSSRGDQTACNASTCRINTLFNGEMKPHQDCTW